MSSVFIHNFGCRVNQAEAFDWSYRLGEAGISVARDWRQADWVVVNACALTARAEADVRQFLKRIQRESPGARIVVTGCLADRTREELARNSAVCRVIPNSLKENLVSVLLELTGEGAIKPEKRFFRSRALVKVQDGCDSRISHDKRQQITIRRILNHGDLDRRQLLAVLVDERNLRHRSH